MDFKALSFVLGLCLGISQTMAHPVLENFEKKPVLADLHLLRASGIPVIVADEKTGVGYSILTPETQHLLQANSHLLGRCGSFESLESEGFRSAEEVIRMFADLNQIEQSHLNYTIQPYSAPFVIFNFEIEESLKGVSAENLREWVSWISSFPNRYNKSSTPNEFVDQLADRLQQMIQASPASGRVAMEAISHSTTPQKSIRVRILGSERPDEIIVLGGHLDSINQSSWGGVMKAPGADDNASGSANLIEALRILLEQKQPERTVELIWYAGEESGLLGSAEIAKAYRAEGRSVIAVLQLDMSLFPGAGSGVIGSMTDFTSPWLRDYLKAINETYIHAKIVDDKCGYGCSDHASWHRQGYPALMPFESSFNKMNRDIHTIRDVISSQSDFEHSALFTKIALVMALDLGNSELKQPY